VGISPRAAAAYAALRESAKYRFPASGTLNVRGDISVIEEAPQTWGHRDPITPDSKRLPVVSMGSL
jgi:hypothetical protein